jgi:hypothetical protein
MFISPPADGAFSFGKIGYGLVELLPDPQIESYQFSAEVRFDSGKASTGNGAVGVYFLHSQSATAQGEVLHYFCEVRFSGSELPLPRHPEIKGHPVSLNVVCVLERGLRAGASVQVGKPVYFPSLPGAWHKVVIQVTPERANALWDGRSVREISRAEMIESVQKKPAPLPFDPRDPKPEFSCRGALGLFVTSASGSFRSVVIEPLGKEKP